MALRQEKERNYLTDNEEMYLQFEYVSSLMNEEVSFTHVMHPTFIPTS
jgi:hypothetical protein